MKIKQVSVFVQNQPGRLLAILEVMEENGINLRALSISESGEFGIVRMIFPDAERGMEALREAGFTARMDWIVSAEIPDVPGGLLNNVVKPLTEAGVNLKYFYAATDAISKKTIVVLKADDLDKAEQILEGK